MSLPTGPYPCDNPDCCGDLRNVMTTVVGIPQSYQGKIRIVINNKDMDTVFRAYIMLTYILWHDNAATAAEDTLHLWYSAFLPDSLAYWIRGPLYQYVAKETEILQRNNGLGPSHMKKLFVKKGVSKCRSRMARELSEIPAAVNLTLGYSDWPCLANYLQRDLPPDEAKSAREAIVASKTRQDYRERFLYRQPHGERPVHVKFTEHGILAPFGRDLSLYTKPNIHIKRGEQFDRILLPEENTHSYIMLESIPMWPAAQLKPWNRRSTIIAPCRIPPNERRKLNTNDCRVTLEEVKKHLGMGPDTQPLLASHGWDPSVLLSHELLVQGQSYEALTPKFIRDISENHFKWKWQDKDLYEKDHTIVEEWPYLGKLGGQDTNLDLCFEDRYPAVRYTEWFLSQ
ncbi:hypothetical protein F4811DRAFT_559117 [Daldinia bambusicola]|nr:hypothetical protein F4811DRAFT_559117 [Daldinia bambusicola]